MLSGMVKKNSLHPSSSTIIIAKKKIATYDFMIIFLWYIDGLLMRVL